jgi:acyl-ACP thioesterase
VPVRLPEGFLAAYAPAAVRRPRSKLRHPPPTAAATAQAWTFRAGDLDVAGHVNNARYWAVVDEILVDEGDTGVDVEVEHKSAAPSGEAIIARDGGALWVSSPEGELYASARLL